MTEDQEPRKLGLSTTQVVGSALAAMSVAFLTSYFGTAGTVIGAALGSIIATIGTATYTWSLRRTSEAVKRTAEQVRTTTRLTNAVPRAVSEGPLREDATADQTEPAGEAEPDPIEETTEAEGTEAETGDGPGGRPSLRERMRGLPWGRVLAASAVVMLIGLAGITVIEAISGDSLASMTGGDDAHETTVGNLLRPSDDKTPAQEPSEAPSQAPSEEDTPDTQQPTQSAEPEPTPEPSSSASPSEQSTEAP